MAPGGKSRKRGTTRRPLGELEENVLRESDANAHYGGKTRRSKRARTAASDAGHLETSEAPAGDGARSVKERAAPGAPRRSLSGRKESKALAEQLASPEALRSTGGCPGYDEMAATMLAFWRETERKLRAKPYMARQRDINERMRSILVDWLVEVHLKFKMAPATLHMAVNILDRYCSCVPVARSRLQLVGVTALFIACKYEEIHPPELRDCVYITDNSFTPEEVLEMELCILTRLKFNLSFPTPQNFLVYYGEASGLPEEDRCLAQYFVERCLQEHEMLQYVPSELAAAGVYLASCKYAKNEGRSPWPAKMRALTEYDEGCVKEIASKILSFARAQPAATSRRRELRAVQQKFSEDLFFCVASLSLPEIPK